MARILGSQVSGAQLVRWRTPPTEIGPEANDAFTPAFLPLSILDAGAAGQLEIELANACIVRLKGAVDPGLLRIAIHAAGLINGDAVASLTVVTS
jgi:hypothetical protein